MPTIRILSGPSGGTEHPLESSSIWIAGGNVVGQTPEVGVELRSSGSTWLLLSRPDPVHVNGEPYRRRRLEPGDLVEAEDWSFEFIAAEADLSASPYRDPGESLSDLSRHPQAAARLALLYEIGASLADVSHFYVGLDRAARRLAEHLGCRRAFLIEDRDGRRIPAYDFRAQDGTVAGAPPFDDGLVGRAIQGRRAVLSSGPPARAAAPVIGGRGAPAALYVEALAGRMLDSDDLDLLRAVSFLLSPGLTSYRLYQENCEARLALEARNREVESLCRRLETDLDDRGREMSRMRAQIDTGTTSSRPIAASPAMRAVLETIELAADSPFPILLLGETGSGKEVIARWIHERSPRRDGPFIAENCAAISDSILDAELFGYEKGAFTGATERRIGLFEAACGGTLFLDEIGEMDLANQAKLLRACQEGMIRRVGGTEAIRVDVRLVWATNRDLESMVKEGHFREDLFFRMNAITVRLPPLRERPEDIPLLAEHLLAKHQSGEPRRRFTREAHAALAAHTWPGNVRELENEVARALALGRGDIDVADLSERVRTGRTAPSGIEYGGGSLAAYLERVEREAILSSWRRHGGSKVQTARELAIDRGTLAKRLKAYGVEDRIAPERANEDPIADG